MAFTHVHPGPKNPSVLTRQHEHRTESIWSDVGYRAILECAHYEGTTHKDLIMNPRVEEKLRASGFYAVAKMGGLQLDHALITALVERWRPETHTFHLPIGEVTVTLQDVEVLLGLRVDGSAVTGFLDHDVVYRATQIQNLLGIRRDPSTINTNSINIKELEVHVQNLDMVTDIEIEQYTRRFIMRILGGRLFPDTSRCKVKLFFLDHLEDLEACGELSWGSAVLACLYRSLCRASKHAAKNIGGCLILLQLWAWERLLMCRPEGVLPLKTFNGPYGARWIHPHGWPNTTTHTLRMYRNQLDRCQTGQFEWCPYPDTTRLPAFCAAGERIYTCRVPLIFLYAVEWHFPDRVVRQFGGFQNIPNAAVYDERLHKLDGKTRCGDLGSFHARYVQMWEDRVAYTEVFQPWQLGANCSPDYKDWFDSITRRLVGNPAPDLVVCVNVLFITCPFVNVELCSFTL